MMISAIAFFVWSALAYVLYKRRDKEKGFTKIGRVFFILCIVLAISTFFNAGILAVLFIFFSAILLFVIVKLMGIYNVGPGKKLSDKMDSVIKKNKFREDGKNEYGLYPLPDEYKTEPEKYEEESFFAGDIPLIPIDDDMNHIRKDRIGDTQIINPYNFRQD